MLRAVQQRPFDLKDPASCHQGYKLFDEKYADIFGRKEVTADRIVAAYDVYVTVLASLELFKEENRLFANYGLTRFLILYLVREALDTDDTGRTFCRNPTPFIDKENGRDRIKGCMKNLVKSVIRPLDNEVTRRNKPPNVFDYKRQLKSSKAVDELCATVIGHYQVILDNGYAKPFSEQWESTT